jgi:hypothetical protein
VKLSKRVRIKRPCFTNVLFAVWENFTVSEMKSDGNKLGPRMRLALPIAAGLL